MKFDVFGHKKSDLISRGKSESTPFICKEPINKEVTFKIGADSQHALGVRRQKVPQ